MSVVAGTGRPGRHMIPCGAQPQTVNPIKLSSVLSAGAHHSISEQSVTAYQSS
jgi:hypothetical protein